MKQMTIERAQKESVTATTKTIAGIKVWPISYGHITWLRERKNLLLTKGQASDASLAEICFAFTKDPVALQSVKGPAAIKAVNEMFLRTPISTMNSLFVYASDQIAIYLKTITSPKKAPERQSRKTASRAKKR